MTPANKNESFEYRLLVTPSYDDTLKKAGIRFLLETTKLFTNFAYVIDVHDAQNGSSLEWTLHGLRAPSMNMPSTGTARFEKIYFELPRTIVFTFVKKGASRTSAEMKFLKNGYVISKAAAGLLKIYLDEDEFEKNRVSDSLAPELKPDVHRSSPHTHTKKK